MFNSGSSDQGFLVRFEHLLGGGLFSLGWQSDFGRDIERPRNNSQTVRFYYPTEDSNRLNLSWERGGVGSFSRVGVNAFFGTYAVVTDQDRYATASTPRSIERADVSASDFEGDAVRRDEAAAAWRATRSSCRSRTHAASTRRSTRASRLR